MSNCPSCWRSIEFEEKYSKVVSCQYCNSILEFWTWELSKIWEQGAFIDFPSEFQVWKTIDWKWQLVRVQGQARYEYEWWFYDDFFVLSGSNKYILRQDDGMIKRYTIAQELQQDIDMNSYKVGEKGLFWSKEIFIQETWLVHLVSMKWQWYTNSYPGKSYNYVDGIIDGHLVYIEKQTDGKDIRILVEEK